MTAQIVDFPRTARTDTAIAAITAAMGFAPSAMQDRVINFIVDGKGSAIVDAVAGAGKTKTLEMALLAIPESASVVLIAFSKLIAAELNSRIAGLRELTGRAFANVKASTFHALGYGALRRRFARIGKPDTGKLANIVARRFVPDEADAYGEFCCKLVALARGEGIGATVRDMDSAWQELIDHHDLFLDGDFLADGETAITEARAIELSRKLLAASNDAAIKQGIIDFDDMLYIPLLLKLRFWQNDFVFVDEAQDTNPVRRALIRSLLTPEGRLVAVGDPRQAIFGFTGASHDSMDLIAADFNTVTLPLSVCYRCSAAVVAHAAMIVPHIEAAPGAIPGGAAIPLRVADIAKTLTANDAILCRNTAPLVSLAFQIIKSGRGCRILGRDIGAGLVRLIKSQRAKSLAELDAKLTEYRAREMARFNAAGEETKAAAIADRVDCVSAIMADMAGGASVADLTRKIAGMFTDDERSPLLTLATIHKAKGKEYPQVAIYRPELMPSPFARQAWQQVQESNLDYVARTRAQETSYYLAA